MVGTKAAKPSVASFEDVTEVIVRNTDISKRERNVVGSTKSMHKTYGSMVIIRSDLDLGEGKEAKDPEGMPPGILETPPGEEFMGHGGHPGLDSSM